MKGGTNNVGKCVHAQVCRRKGAAGDQEHLCERNTWAGPWRVQSPSPWVKKWEEDSRQSEVHSQQEWIEMMIILVWVNDRGLKEDKG